MSIKAEGSALISALFIMTLVAIAATAMSTRLQLDIYRTRMTIVHDKSYLASQLVAFWAMSTLSHKKEPNTTRDPTGKLMNFPVPFQHAYPDVTITGQLTDLQSRFNVNNVQNTSYQPMFFNLLKDTVARGTEDQYRLILAATVRWVSPYAIGQHRDEFLDHYITQNPAYLPAYQPMKNISEFRLVEGVNARIYQLMSPHVTALPEITPLNINTANKHVLKALGHGLTENDVNELLKARDKEGIKTLQALNPLLQRLDIAADQITLESHYFASVAHVSTPDQELTNTTVFKRTENKKGKVTITILSETLS